MAKKEQNDGFWPRFVITLVVVVWVALVGGNWLGHFVISKVEDNPSQAAADELNIPSPRPKPWRTADPALQREIDEQRQGLSGEGSKKPAQVVTASPVPQKEDGEEKPKEQAMATPAPKPEKKPAAEKPAPPAEEAPPAPAATPETAESPAANEPPEPTPAGGPAAASSDYQLQFGSFSSEENARELARKLEAEGQTASVEAVQTDSGTVYRVSGGSYADESSAKAQADRLRGAGIDVYVRAQ